MNLLLGHTVDIQEGFENSVGEPSVQGNALTARVLVETIWQKATHHDAGSISRPFEWVCTVGRIRDIHEVGSQREREPPEEPC